MNTPYIGVMFGDSGVQFFLIVERNICEEANTFMDALKALVSSYFVFHMEYPRPIRPILLYIQFDILSYKDNQPVPNCITHFKSVMSKL